MQVLRLRRKSQWSTSFRVAVATASLRVAVPAASVGLAVAAAAIRVAVAAASVRLALAAATLRLSLPATLPEPSRRPVLQGAAGPLELPGDAQAMLHCSAGYVHVRHLRDGAPPLAAEDVILYSSQRSRGHALRRRAAALCCPHCTRTPLVLTRCS